MYFGSLFILLLIMKKLRRRFMMMCYINIYILKKEKALLKLDNFGKKK